MRLAKLAYGVGSGVRLALTLGSIYGAPGDGVVAAIRRRSDSENTAADSAKSRTRRYANISPCRLCEQPYFHARRRYNSAPRGAAQVISYRVQDTSSGSVAPLRSQNETLNCYVWVDLVLADEGEDGAT